MTRKNDPRRNEECENGDKTPIEIYEERLESCKCKLLEITEPVLDEARYHMHCMTGILDQELLLNLFVHCGENGEPIPESITMLLAYDLKKVLSGYEGEWFKKLAGKTKPSVHPRVATLQWIAVYYISTCKAKGWDKAPIKTIEDACGVSRTTVHRWIKKYPLATYTEIDPDECSDELLKEVIMSDLDTLKCSRDYL